MLSDRDEDVNDVVILKLYYRIIFNFTNIVGRELCEHILHGGTMQEKMVNILFQQI